jgi:hypothetical protein
MATTEERIARLEARVRMLVAAQKKTSAEKISENFKTVGIWALVGAAAVALALFRQADDAAANAKHEVDNLYHTVGQTDQIVQEVTDDAKADKALLNALDTHDKMSIASALEKLNDPGFTALVYAQTLKATVDADDARLNNCVKYGDEIRIQGSPPNNGVVLDVRGNLWTEGTPVDVASANGTTAQKWTIRPPNGKGY